MTEQSKIPLPGEGEQGKSLFERAEGAFGLGALNDGNFISRVEHGRQPSFSTIDRVYRYIEVRTKAVHKKAARR